MTNYRAQLHSRPEQTRYVYVDIIALDDAGVQRGEPLYVLMTRELSIASDAAQRNARAAAVSVIDKAGWKMDGEWRERSYGWEVRVILLDWGTLKDAETHEAIRPAHKSEWERSRNTQGGIYRHLTSARLVYVEGGPQA